MSVAPLDEHLVDELCRAAVAERGDADPVVRAHLRRVAPLAGAVAGERLVRAAVARLDGLGALDALLADDTVDEVLVNAHGDVWVERDGRMSRSGHLGPADLAVVTERILAPLGRRLDRTNPIVDARLPDGSRVCAVIPPVSPDGACLSVRRFRDRSLGLDAFASDALVAVLELLVAARCNVIVSGATSSGKTSLLNATLGCCPPGERIVTIEDTAELLPAADHLVRLEAATGDTGRASADLARAAGAHGAAAATRPPRRRRGARAGGAGAGAGVEHRPRRFVVDVPREQRARCAAPPGDARRSRPRRRGR